jgi:hypothetical protein
MEYIPRPEVIEKYAKLGAAMAKRWTKKED